MEPLNGKVVRHNMYDEIKTVSHYKDGILHNENGPAYIEYNMDGKMIAIHYIVNGLYHNIHGPAINYYLTSGDSHAYFINGERINSKEEFEIIVKHLALS